MNLPEKLKQCRLFLGYTQEEVATSLHVSRKTISGWENGRSFPDTNSLVHLSDIYHVPVDDLLRDDRLLKHYADAVKDAKATSRVVVISYFLNVLLWLVNYVGFFGLQNNFFKLLQLILLVNIVVYLTHFYDWNRFKQSKYSVRVVIIFFTAFIIHILFSLLDPIFLSDIHDTNVYFISGVIFGRLILIILISLSMEVTFCLKPRSIRVHSKMSE